MRSINTLNAAQSVLKPLMNATFGEASVFSAAALLALSVARAQTPVTINNYSFEVDAPGGNRPTYTITSWTKIPNNDWMGVNSTNFTVTHPLAGPADGNQYAQLNSNPGEPDAGIYQDVGALQPNTKYTLTVAIGARNDNGPGNGAWAPGYISLINGTDNNGTRLAVSSLLPPKNTWQDLTITYSTGPSVSGELVVLLSVSATAQVQACFDNVRLTAQASSAPTPTLASDTLPAYAETFVGDSITYTATFATTSPLNLQWLVVKSGITNDVAGATSTNLTLSNLQTNDSGLYMLRASAASDSRIVAYSSASQLKVTAPTAVSGITAVYSCQSGWGASSITTNFYPNWALSWPNLVSGTTVLMGLGNFGNRGCNPDVSILTDGTPGFLSYWPGNNSSLSLTCMGNDTSGKDVTFALPSSANGYDVTNIVVYGGWGDPSRDGQDYEVLYSTMAAPSTFFHLAYVHNEFSSSPANKQSATRSRLIPVGAALAKNVAQIKLNYNQFGDKSPENSDVGVSEVVIGGTLSQALPMLAQDITPLMAVDVVGGTLQISAAFSGASSYQWQKNGTNIPGADSPTLTLNNLQLSDTATNGGYSLVASNAVGAVASRGCYVVIGNAATAPINSNIVASIARQEADSPTFAPTWDAAADLSGNLLSVNNCTYYSPTEIFNEPNANYEYSGGGIPALTDGSYGQLVSDGTCPAMATCGPNAGTLLGYTLDTGSNPNGYSLSKITIAGGWANSGRDAQIYTLYYSTVTAPDALRELTYSSYNPVLLDSGHRSLVRTTFTPKAGALVDHVAKVYIDFRGPGNENGYCGYDEVCVVGTPTANSTPGIAITQANTINTAVSLETPNLIGGQLPSGQGGNFNQENAGGLPALTDGSLANAGVTNYATCGDNGGNFVIYSCTNRCWTLTNIVVYSGWGNYNRDGQFYTVSYTTPEDPTTWISLTGIRYNPAPADGVDGTITPSVNRVSFSMPDGGALADNVAQIKFDFSNQNGYDYGYSGYGQIVLQGSVDPRPRVLPVVTLANQQTNTTWGTVESGSLIAGKLPASFVGGAGGFTAGGCNVTNLTDGHVGFGYAYGASCGSDPNYVNSLTFTSSNGWNLTNIVVYSAWADGGREAQIYNVYYSTTSSPALFLPLATVQYNPAVGANTPSANRSSITPPAGQTMLASNVATVKFDFTPQGSQDSNWSGYSEILLLGTDLGAQTPAVAPVLASPLYVAGVGGGNGSLIMTGTGGTPSRGYVWLTTTNVSLPLSQWATNSVGALNGFGAFSNSLPVRPSEPGRFFKLKMQ